MTSTQRQISEDGYPKYLDAENDPYTYLVVPNPPTPEATSVHTKNMWVIHLAEDGKLHLNVRHLATLMGSLGDRVRINACGCTRGAGVA